jgi:hypothetical protein
MDAALVSHLALADWGSPHGAYFATAPFVGAALLFGSYMSLLREALDGWRLMAAGAGCIGTP